MIRFGAEVCADAGRASRLEWLETNGIGGFATSSILGLNTRRYHGLLTAATKPPVGRVVMLSKLEETLIVGGERYELSANRYPGVVHPRGFQYLREFRLDPCPVWIYQAGGVQVEKRVSMVHGENTTVVEYEIAGDAALEVRPLIAFRDYHATTHENDGLNPAVEDREGVVKLAPYTGLPPLYLNHGGAQVGPGNGWYRNFEFDRERERGLDFREDLYNPLMFTFTGSARIVASTEAHPASPETAADPEACSSLVTELTRAANQFIVKRGNGKTVIAGYHWFTDWGRDTMIALPGLTLVTGRYDVARQILAEFAAGDGSRHAPQSLSRRRRDPRVQHRGRHAVVLRGRSRLRPLHRRSRVRARSLYPKLKDSIDWHLRGTRYGIRVDADGLLCCGRTGRATDLDGRQGRRLGGDAATRQAGGDPGALVQRAAHHARPGARAFRTRASRVSHAHSRTRPARASGGSSGTQPPAASTTSCRTTGSDASIRPNQIFAVSLTHSMLDAAQSRQVVEIVERELLHAARPALALSTRPAISRPL